MAEASHQSNMKSTTVSTSVYVENIQSMRKIDIQLKYNNIIVGRKSVYVLRHSISHMYIHNYTCTISNHIMCKINVLSIDHNLYEHSAQKPLVRKALLESTEYYMYVLSTWIKVALH